MLASKPTSGLSLYVMMERVVSLRNTVSGEGSSGSSHSETAYEVCSNRLPGFPAAPRPRTGKLFDCSDMQYHLSAISFWLGLRRLRCSARDRSPRLQGTQTPFVRNPPSYFCGR